MAENKKHIRMPLCFKEFQCVGGSCEDNCCIGWDVEIDKTTYQLYQKVKDRELSQLFHDCIYKNPHSYDSNIDYALVELAENNRCSFLNEKHLCKIQAKLGHDYLSNVCATYPRYSNEINGVIEYSLNVSCPEAARLILTNRQGLSFLNEEKNTSPKMIINCTVNTNANGGNILLKHFIELREFTVSVLQNRDYNLWERILILGYVYKELQEIEDGTNVVPVSKLIDVFSKKIQIGDWKAELSSPAADNMLQCKLIKEITENLNNLKVIDSQNYISFVEECSMGLGITARSDSYSDGKAYQKAFDQYYRPFMKDHEYLLENYLVNYVFGGLFPAAESTEPFEAYMMLVIRYALIKYNLIGISAFRKGLTEKDCVRFIQVFSKAIEHHHTYLEGITSKMSKKKQFSLSVAELLIKN